MGHMEANNLTGQVLAGRYRIDELVGQGSTSAVYKAHDATAQQIVAVKVILPALAEDGRFQARFEEEAAAVAPLRHRNLVQVLDYGHDAELYYLVEEFVPGETLKARLRRLSSAGKRLSVAEAVRYPDCPFSVSRNGCDSAELIRRGLPHCRL